MKFEVLQADYHNEQHARDLGELLNSYAMDPMGGGEALADEVRRNLAAELARRPDAFSILCYIDEKPAGLINCFEGFSTFKCKPLVNIHDVMVIDGYRGHGVSQRMMDKVEEIARQRGCCKLTLEVLEGNKSAQRAYLRYGFSGYQLDPETGHALFWEKYLDAS
jgi:GNAT superfamily N-acetyltransferase